MRNLILFLWRNNFFFLFLLLEVLAVYIIVQENYYHKNVFIHSSSQITGKIYEITDDITGYFKLKKTNTELAEENARLRNHSDYAFMKTPLKTIRHKDTLYHKYMEFIPARVISSSVSRRNNNWMINKGKNQGIEKNTGVISSNGVIGIIVEVSANYSLVQSVLHKQTTLSAMLKKNKQKGFVTWPGVNYRKGELNDIPSHVNVQEGDTIVTSGNSLLFPENILIGTVLDVVLEQGKSFYNIDIKFSEDYNNSEYVYVVTNLMKGEQQDLLERRDDEVE
ncbi:MAG: rod shape-determining protein MreC [Bacteroidales bacterium]|nr:rod shape-determining protein MreC [Bacteroidales bacterium]MCF8327008.1 rod shape-determining protein MreC [Bacteroidales bacterium]